MVARVNTVAFQGIDVVDVDVQVQIAPGLPAFSIVGLPDKAVAESRERVRSAFNALGLALPPKRITVNLAPADLAKEGSHFDLPIALGLLAAMEVLPADEMADAVALRELALDGRISPVAGVLPAAMVALALVPDLMWYIFLTIIAFWFGGKIIEKAPRKFTPPNVKDLREIKQLRDEMRSDQRFEEDMADEATPLSNASILEWNKRREDRRAPGDN